MGDTFANDCLRLIYFDSSIMRYLICLKQEKMKTTPEHCPNEETKQLFRQLFEAQYKFERYTDY